MDASLFVKIIKLGHSMSKLQVIGVTGTRGKSTVTQLIYEIIKNSGRRVFLGGNVKGLASLPLLKKVKNGDVVVMELDSWQLQGFEEAKTSPNIAVFTTFCPTIKIITKTIWTDIFRQSQYLSLAKRKRLACRRTESIKVDNRKR